MASCLAIMDVWVTFIVSVAFSHQGHCTWDVLWEDDLSTSVCHGPHNQSWIIHHVSLSSDTPHLTEFQQEQIGRSVLKIDSVNIT